MTIAHLLPFAGIGGTETATLRIIRAARETGIDSVAFCLRPLPELDRFFTDAGVRVVHPVTPEPSIRNLPRFLRESRQLAAAMREAGADVVHCADTLAGMLGSTAGWLAGLPVICHVRNRYEGIKYRDRHFLQPVTHFVFVSHNTWDSFPFRVARPCGSVLYDGVRAPALAEDRAVWTEAVRREFDVPEGAVLVGMIARVSPQKDYDTLVQAAAQVVAAHPNTVFLIVGDNAIAPEHRAHFSKVWDSVVHAGLERHFRFTGFRENAAALAWAFDIAVLCTHFEGLPLVVLEKMACGLPVVATAVDGVPEAIIDGQTGLLHQHGDAAALAAHLLALIGDPERRRSLGSAARLHVQERFSDQQFAAGIAALYRRFGRGASTSGAARQASTPG